MIRVPSMLMAAAAAVAALAPVSSAAPPRREEPLRLEIRPGGGPQRTGLPHTLEAQVTGADGAGFDGVAVDFELMAGPADDDVGTAGATPESPDLTCVTAGGSAHRPAVCTVGYVQDDNVGGSDAVMAWIDADGVDATVEADLGEGENQHAPGPGGCAVGSKGRGRGAEPDATDCVNRRWMARVPAVLDVSPDIMSADVGTAAALEAVVLDQFGDPLAASGAEAFIGFEILDGSAHDPGDGTDFGFPDAGTCTTGPGGGGCAVPVLSSRAGTDVFCAYLVGQAAACAEPVDAPERDNGADVVGRSWGDLAPPSGGEDLAPVGAPGEKTPPTRRKEDPDRPRDDDGRPDREPPSDADKPAEPDQMEGGGESEGGNAAPVALSPSPPAPTAPPSAATPNREQDRPARVKPRRAIHAPTAAPRRVRPQREPAARQSRRTPERSAGAVAVADERSRGAQTGGRRAPRLARLTRAAAETADRYSFPLGLTLLVLAFIAVQGRIDRRDPKLRLAPVDSKHDLLPFT